MTITLFADRNFRGASLVVRNDRDTLRRTTVGNDPHSIKMTSDNDAILLCNKSNWNGEVRYLRGKREIADLEQPGSITSVRVTPFTVAVNITIVTGEGGELPGTWANRTEASADINTIITMVNAFFADEEALVQIELSDLTFRPDEKRFRMAEKEWGSIPASWKRAHAVDIVFPDTLQDAVGLGNPPWSGKFCLVSARRDSVDQMARTFAHELGHFWGLAHESGSGNAENIMTQSKDGLPLISSRLRDNQIQEIQQVLARNLARQGDRQE
jgi:hypothetical protein